MLKKILKFFLGVISIPACLAVSLTLCQHLSKVEAPSLQSQRYFIVGIVTYVLIHIVFFKPDYLYILGHEVMHVLATWFLGGKIGSFDISQKGGKVTTTKANIFIALFPYLLPFYTVFVVLVFLILKHFFKIAISYQMFLFLIGVTLSFHLLFTVEFLKTRQPDFSYGGYLFSLCLIYMVNLIVIGVILSLLFKEFIFIEFLEAVYLQAKDIYVGIFTQLFG